MDALNASTAFKAFNDLGGSHLDPGVRMGDVEALFERAARQHDELAAAAEVFVGLVEGGFFPHHNVEVAVETVSRVLRRSDARPLLRSLAEQVLRPSIKEVRAQLAAAVA